MVPALTLATCPPDALRDPPWPVKLSPKMAKSTFHWSRTASYAVTTASLRSQQKRRLLFMSERVKQNLFVNNKTTWLGPALAGPGKMLGPSGPALCTNFHRQTMSKPGNSTGMDSLQTCETLTTSSPSFQEARSSSRPSPSLRAGNT